MDRGRQWRGHNSINKVGTVAPICGPKQHMRGHNAWGYFFHLGKHWAMWFDGIPTFSDVMSQPSDTSFPSSPHLGTNNIVSPLSLLLGLTAAKRALGKNQVEPPTASIPCNPTSWQKGVLWSGTSTGQNTQISVFGMGRRRGDWDCLLRHSLGAQGMVRCP